MTISNTETKLFYFLLGCTPNGRHIEQHDVFFAMGQKVAEVLPAIKNFWPEAEKLHIDCWREVTNINGYKVKVISKKESADNDSGLSLFFINLGGYKKDEFNEFHFIELFAAQNQAEAIKLAKQTPFFKQYHFNGAKSHIDDKYGVDVDEVYPVTDILQPADKANFRIVVTNEPAEQLDEIHLGYIRLSSLETPK